MLGELEGIGVALGETEGKGVEVFAGFGFAAGFLIATPLFQRNLLPCLTQVYLIFEIALVVPSLLHLVPEIDAEKVGVFEKNKVEVTNRVANLLILAICIK